MDHCIGTSTGEEVIQVMSELGIRFDEKEGSVCDFGSGIGHIGCEIAHEVDGVHEVHCVDPLLAKYPQVMDGSQDAVTQLLASMHEHELESYFGDTVSQIRARVCEDAKKVFADKGLSDKIRYHETSSELDDESQDLVMANYLVTNVRFIHPFLHEWQRLLHRDGNLLIIDHGGEHHSLDLVRNLLKNKNIPHELKTLPHDRKEHDDTVIKIPKESLGRLIKEIEQKAPDNGPKEISIQMGDYVESFVVIPFTRIFRQQLTPEESQLVARGIYEKDFYEDMEKFKKGKHVSQNGRSGFASTGETDGEVLNLTHMIFRVDGSDTSRVDYYDDDQTGEEIEELAKKMNDLGIAINPW